MDGSTYSTTTAYDSAGRIGGVTYPSGSGVTYLYNPSGYLSQVKDSASTLVYWAANTYDAEDHLTEATFGNGIITTKVYTPETGRIATIKAGPGDSVQNLGFTFNTLGNLTQRVDVVEQTTDALSYDGLNRLTQAITSNPSLPLNVTKTVSYDAIGNIVTKSDVGTYSYDPARVHAVASIAPGGTGTVTASYAYDGNGNMLTGRGRTVTWTSFDMVDRITQDPNWVSFTYDSEHARLKQVSSDGSTKYYLNDPISGVMAEMVDNLSTPDIWNDYIMAGGEMVALKVSGAASQIRYFHKDHLGSIVALTDESGAVVERDSFDAWGQRRNATGQDDPLYPGQSLTSQITRGYTGHEQLDSVGLVHMNGRIYEPVIGKMMSADPTVPNEFDGQAFNRYAYVLNNPLSFTDPTGFRPDLEQRDKRGQHSRGGYGKNSVGGHSVEADLARARGNQMAGDAPGWDVPGMTTGVPENEPSYVEHLLDLWSYTYIEGPATMIGRPIGYIGLGMQELEDVCGPCFDEGLAASAMGAGPPGALAGAGAAMTAKGWQALGRGARIVGGFDTAVDEAAALEKARAIVEIKGPYQRPANATTRQQRASVQGKPCTDCGATTTNQVANHIEPLVKEHYRTGTIDLNKMRSLNAVNSQCPTCSAKQGAAMRQYSRQMKRELGFE